MNPIISLIAPAYNVEKYIEACVHSCENQDLPRDSYEIIIVNDGSTDSTYSTIERLSGVYENIRIVTQKNQGLSVARNNGFKLARGKYVWFIDSDDCISSNCLGKCLEIMERDDLDALVVAPSVPFREIFPYKFDSEADVSKVYDGESLSEHGAIYLSVSFGTTIILSFILEYHTRILNLFHGQLLIACELPG